MLIQVQNPCLYLVWSIGLFLKIQFSPLIPADAFKAILWSRFQASDWSHATKTQNWLVGTSICSIHRRADVAMSGIPILSYLRFISLGSLDTAQLCRFDQNISLVLHLQYLSSMISCTLIFNALFIKLESFLFDSTFWT